MTPSLTPLAPLLCSVLHLVRWQQQLWTWLYLALWTTCVVLGNRAKVPNNTNIVTTPVVFPICLPALLIHTHSSHQTFRGEISRLSEKSLKEKWSNGTSLFLPSFFRFPSYGTHSASGGSGSTTGCLNQIGSIWPKWRACKPRSIFFQPLPNWASRDHKSLMDIELIFQDVWILHNCSLCCILWCICWVATVQHSTGFFYNR